MSSENFKLWKWIALNVEFMNLCLILISFQFAVYRLRICMSIRLRNMGVKAIVMFMARSILVISNQSCKNHVARYQYK